MTLPPSLTDVPQTCKPLTDVVNAIAVFQNQTTTIYGCVRYHILVSGNVMRTCVNGSWTGKEPVCHLDSVMPKPYLVLLIVSITVLVFGVWIPADFYRFRQKKKECREKQQRIQMIKRIGPMHVKMFAEPSIEGAEEAPKTSVRFGISSIIAFFKFAKKGKHKRHSGSAHQQTDSETDSNTLNSLSEPSTSATPLAIIQERNYESVNETSALNAITCVNSDTTTNDDNDDAIGMSGVIKTHDTILVNSKSQDLSKANVVNDVKCSSSVALGKRDNSYTVSIGGGMSKSFSEENWKSAKLNKDIRLDNRKVSDPTIRNKIPVVTSNRIAPDKDVDILQNPHNVSNSVVPNVSLSRVFNKGVVSNVDVPLSHGVNNIVVPDVDVPPSRGFNNSVLPNVDVPPSRGFNNSVLPNVDVPPSRGYNSVVPCSDHNTVSYSHGVSNVVPNVDRINVSPRGINTSVVPTVDVANVPSRGLNSGVVPSVDHEVVSPRRVTLPPISGKSKEQSFLPDHDQCK